MEFEIFKLENLENIINLFQESQSKSQNGPELKAANSKTEHQNSSGREERHPIQLLEENFEKFCKKIDNL
jgi:hypothetical protein